MYGHPHHIPQPPHTAGHPFSGLRARIDADQIPSPIDAADDDAALWDGRTYMTLPGSHVPLASTDYVAFDQGNSSPRFIRLTTWNIPSTSDLALACQIPVAAVIQPFAQPDAREEDVLVVECGEGGPARCANCRAYVNPWCTWTSGGSRWKCNLCDHETEVASDYFCNLDANFMRLDYAQRPELSKGTVDFTVPDAYWAPHPLPKLTPSYYSPEPPPTSPTRRPEPLHVLFVIDVSVDAIQSGFTRAACTALRSVLYGASAADDDDVTPLQPCFPPGSKASVMTVDSTLHFYNLSPGLQQAEMLVVPDIEDVFCPLRDAVFADPQASRVAFENLLEAIPLRFGNTTMRVSALGAALRGCLAALSRKGGQVVLFQSTLPSHGPGALAARPDESKLFDTDKEKTLFAPRDRLWGDLGEECAEEGIGVSVFIGTGPGNYIDVASIGAVASMTGGDVFFHPRFSAARDMQCMQSQLRRLFTRTSVYNCMARVRCSNGLRVSTYHGNFNQRTPTDLELGALDADTAFSVALEHTRALDERKYAFLQCAVLHTTAAGQRRVRTVNLAAQVAALAGNVFRFADLDTTVCHMAKEVMSSLRSQKASEIREDLTERCSSILLAYRRNCAAATAPSQLILPEAFKLLPLYTLAIQKNKTIKGHNVAADTRNFLRHRILSMSVRSTLRHLHPRFLALHDLTDDVALPMPDHESDPTRALRLPSLMRTSHVFMEAHGMYLIDNEEMMILWIGANVAPQVLMDVFGIESVHQLDPHMTSLPVLQTRLSAQLRTILAARRQERGGLDVKLAVARQNLDAIEIEFSDMLIEDRNNGAMSYIDYLCFVHKQINAALTNGTTISAGMGQGMRGAPW